MLDDRKYTGNFIAALNNIIMFFKFNVIEA